MRERRFRGAKTPWKLVSVQTELVTRPVVVELEETKEADTTPLLPQGVRDQVARKAAVSESVDGLLFALDRLAHGGRTRSASGTRMRDGTVVSGYRVRIADRAVAHVSLMSVPAETFATVGDALRRFGVVRSLPHIGFLVLSERPPLGLHADVVGVLQEHFPSGTAEEVAKDRSQKVTVLRFVDAPIAAAPKKTDSEETKIKRVLARYQETGNTTLLRTGQTFDDFGETADVAIVDGDAEATILAHERSLLRDSVPLHLLRHSATMWTVFETIA
jgi:hypothetical protein